jgi:hypothetical protein
VRRARQLRIIGWQFISALSALRLAVCKLENDGQTLLIAHPGLQAQAVSHNVEFIVTNF